MANLSVNLNKIAVLRNSRGGNIPDVLEAAEKRANLSHLTSIAGLNDHEREQQSLTNPAGAPMRARRI